MEQLNEQLQTKTPFLDLTRDYGFKIVFADPDRKELMIGFLNKIITERNIIDIRFLNTDILAPEEDGKSPNYDISCLDDEGSKILSDKLNFLFLQLPVASSSMPPTGTMLSKENYQSTTEWNAMQFR